MFLYFMIVASLALTVLRMSLGDLLHCQDVTVGPVLYSGQMMDSCLPKLIVACHFPGSSG